jgi:chemotaxis protein CheC
MSKNPNEHIPGGGLYEDILKEICSFGAGNAAARLSKLTGKKVKIELPNVWVARPADGFPFLPKGEKEIGIGITTKFGMEKRGIVFTLIQQEEARKLLSFVLDREVREIGEMEESALMEIGNILTGAIIGSIANFIGVRVEPDVPQITIDMPLAIIDGAIAKQLESIRWIFFTAVSIRIAIEKISMILCLFPFFDLVKEVLKKMNE